MQHPHIGLRGKILGFYGATLAVVVALELLAQNAALGAGQEFEDRLARYHAIQGLRTSLADFRALGEKYMREHLPEEKIALDSALADLASQATNLGILPAESQDAFFEARAIRRGLDAYMPLARRAFERRAANRPDGYQVFVQADRIGAYVDGYLSQLLSLAMGSGIIHYREIVARSAENRRLALVGLLGASTLALAFAALFASSIAAPVRRLAEAADRMASGNLEVEPIVASTRDEVEVLARCFNDMSANIRALVEGLKEKVELERLLHEETLSRVSMGRALREAQFMNLQDQIRPHFLFNALNTIARSALFEGAPETERLAQSLGKLMRYALSERGAFVTVAEEFDTLREYLAFQAIRFGPRLSWEVRSDSEAESVLVPRFTLQPIVENAVRHGIEPKVEGGRVIVSARRLRDRVRLVVADTGQGMNEELLVELRAAAAGRARGAASMMPGEGGPGIGMANLEQRLAYRFADKARLGIASRKGRGTVIRISLPVEPLTEGGSSQAEGGAANAV